MGLGSVEDAVQRMCMLNFSTAGSGTQLFATTFVQWAYAKLSDALNHKPLVALRLSTYDRILYKAFLRRCVASHYLTLVSAADLRKAFGH